MDMLERSARAIEATETSELPTIGGWRFYKPHATAALLAALDLKNHPKEYAALCEAGEKAIEHANEVGPPMNAAVAVAFVVDAVVDALLNGAQGERDE